MAQIFSDFGSFLFKITFVGLPELVFSQALLVLNRIYAAGLITTMKLRLPVSQKFTSKMVLRH